MPTTMRTAMIPRTMPTITSEFWPLVAAAVTTASYILYSLKDGGNTLSVISYTVYAIMPYKVIY